MSNLYEYPTFQVDRKKYSELLIFCHHMAKTQLPFCKSFQAKNNNTCKEKFIIDELIKLANSPIDGVPVKVTENSFLNFISKNFPRTIEDSKLINNHLKKNPKQWVDFMNTFPLDQYAIAMGSFLIKENLLAGNILELGAGVGNTSHLVYPEVTDPSNYRRTDINIMLLKKSKQKEKISFYNFDEPGHWKKQNLIFATNALHCASNKEQTFKYVYEMLDKDGYFVISEGAPETSCKVPWALNFACGYFDGWWDKGGFKSYNYWIKTYEAAGFINIKIKKIMAGEFHLGNIILGQK